MNILDYYNNSITLHNSIDIYNLSNKYNSIQLKNKILYIIRQFPNFYLESEDFISYNYEIIDTICKSPHLLLPVSVGEIYLFNKIIEWSNANWELQNINQYVSSLLNTLNLLTIPSKCIKTYLFSFKC